MTEGLAEARAGDTREVAVLRVVPSLSLISAVDSQMTKHALKGDTTLSGDNVIIYHYVP